MATVSRKRNASPAEHGTKVKKAKTSSEQTLRKRKRRVSGPQHLRGTNIQPSQEDAVVNQARMQPVTLSTNHLPQPGDDADQQSDNSYNTADDMLPDSPDKQLRREVHLSQTTNAKHTVENPSKIRDLGVQQDGLPVKASDKPGLRKLKRRKSAKAARKAQETAETQSVRTQSSASDTGAAKATKSVVETSLSKTGDQTKTAKTKGHGRKKTVARKSMPIEAEEDTAGSDAEAPKPGEDGVRVSQVGRPGPKRRKKQRSAVPEPTTQPSQPTPEPTAPLPAPSVHSDEGYDEQFDSSQSQPEAAQGESSDQAVPPADRIPTPPSSPPVPQEEEVSDDEEVEAEESVPVAEDAVSEHDRTQHITTWLDSQEMPAPPDPSLPADPKPKRKRKRKSQYQEDDSDEYQDQPEPEPKSKTVKRGTVSGAWSAAEKALADKIFNGTVEREKDQLDFAAHTLRCNTLDWTNIGQFKIDMNNAFPGRTISSIRKFAKRRFHPYNSGPWTAEEDELLLQNYDRFEDSWINIADFVDRAPQDCRDRYRNIVSLRDTRETGPWSESDEVLLGHAVEMAVERVKRETTDPEVRDNREKLEMMINWGCVMDTFHERRSEHQCRQKWQSLKRASKVNGEPPGTEKATEPANDVPADEMTKKQKALESSYSKLLPGDIADCLTDIYLAFSKNLDQIFRDESTFWSIVAQDRSQHSRFPSKLRRRAFYGALEMYQCDALQDCVGMAAKANWMLEHMIKLDDEGKLDVGQKAYKLDWVPPPPKKKKERISGRPTAEEREHCARVDARRKKEAEEAKKMQERSKRANEGAQETVVPKQVQSQGHVQPSGRSAAPPGQPAAQQAAPRRRTNRPRLSEAAVYDSDEEGLPIIPETQTQQEGPGADEEQVDILDELEVSSFNSRYEGSLRSGTPRFSPEEFMARCRAVGQSQHAEYVRGGRR